MFMRTALALLLLPSLAFGGTVSVSMKRKALVDLLESRKTINVFAGQDELPSKYSSDLAVAEKLVEAVKVTDEGGSADELLGLKDGKVVEWERSISAAVCSDFPECATFAVKLCGDYSVTATAASLREGRCVVQCSALVFLLGCDK